MDGEQNGENIKFISCDKHKMLWRCDKENFICPFGKDISHYDDVMKWNHRKMKFYRTFGGATEPPMPPDLRKYYCLALHCTPGDRIRPPVRPLSALISVQFECPTVLNIYDH